MNFTQPRGGQAQRPRVSFLSQWFPPEPGVPEISFGIAKGLQDCGFNVRAITGAPNYPTGRVQAGYSAASIRSEVVRGVPTLRVPLYPSHGSSAMGRVLNYASFAASAAVFGRQYLSTSDVNFVISSPATLDASAAFYKLLWQRPYILSVQDLWPESIYATGFLEHGLPRHLTEAPLRKYCDATMRAASAVLVICPSMRDAVVARGVRAERVHVMYNWVNEEVFSPGPSNGRLRAHLGVPEDHLIFLYSGNVGSAQNLELWIDAFADGGLPPSAHLVVQGDGHMKEELQARARGVETIHFLPQLPSLTEAVENMRGADAMVISLADHPLSSHTLPSKIPSALALGKAVVATVPGDAARILEESGAGFVAEPGSSASARAVVARAIDAGRDSLEEMGQQARKHYDLTMSRAIGLRVLARIIHDVSSKHGH